MVTTQDFEIVDMGWTPVIDEHVKYKRILIQRHGYDMVKFGDFKINEDNLTLEFDSLKNLQTAYEYLSDLNLEGQQYSFETVEDAQIWWDAFMERLKSVYTDMHNGLFCDFLYLDYKSLKEPIRVMFDPKEFIYKLLALTLMDFRKGKVHKESVKDIAEDIEEKNYDK